MRADVGEQLSDLAIRRSVGPRAYTAGRAYVRSDRVRELTVDADGRLLFAAVQGTAAQPYRVVVTPLGTARWTGRCTCLVATNCKHVAAVMLAASDSRAPTHQPPPTWEGPVAALARAQSVADVETGSPLALQLEIVTGASSRYAVPGMAPSPAPACQRIRLRPVARGKSGAWVRTGISWRDLQYDLGRRRPDRELRDSLRGFYTAFLAQQRSHYGYGSDSTVHLDDLGPMLWPLLGQAADAGLGLVLAKPSVGPVVVADRASVSLDLRRPSPSSETRLEPIITVDGRRCEASAVQLLGDPVHGLFVVDGDAGLILAPLDRRPDERLTMLLRLPDGLQIPAVDLPRFLQSYYPGLRQAVPVTSSDSTVDLPEVLPPQLAVAVTFRPRHEVDLEWGFAYRTDEAVTVVALRPRDSEDVVRDRAHEQRLLDAVAPEVQPLLSGHRRLTGIDAVAFTRDVLPGLRDDDDLLLTLVGEPSDFRPAQSAPVVHLGTSDSTDGPDWYDLAVSVTIDGEEIPFDQLFTALAAQQTHLVLASGTYFDLDRPELEQLSALIAEARALQDREGDGLRLSVYQAALWEELLELGVVESQSRRWADTVQGLLSLDDVTPPPVPAGLDAELRPYQLDGYHWLAFLWQHNLGGILADDMGLGKTVQALAMMCHAHETRGLPGPFLVVAPTSVVANWEQEATRFAPGLKVRTVTETSRRRATPLAEDVAGADLVITSYALFRIDAESYQGLEWAGLVLDEAQFVKNHQAKAYQCARRLPAPFKLAITGTPLENSLMDLWSLLSIVAPGLFPSPQRFSEDYRTPIERGGAPERLATLRRRVAPLMRRRTKEQVGTDLPPKQEQVLEVLLNPRHQKIYQTHLQRERQKVLGLLTDLDKNRFAIFRSLTLLRQLSLDPALVDDAYADVPASKVDVFLEHIREVVDGGHRALVFSQFTGFLRTVRERLDAESVPYCYLDGRTRNRPARIAQFKDGDAPVFLISLKAGGVGLNLTEADYCFVLDPWWNPAVEAQAVDRAHRIGQDKTVMVYRLVAAGTIEEKVMQLKARKQSLFARVMDDGELLSAPLSADDIRGLFG